MVKNEKFDVLVNHLKLSELKNEILYAIIFKQNKGISELYRVTLVTYYRYLLI